MILLPESGATEPGRRPDLDSIRLLGVRIDRLSLPGLLRLVLERTKRRDGTVILYVNVHCMNVAIADAPYRSVLETADIVYCDGTGVRLGARLAGMSLPPRMTGADWIHDLCRVAVRHDLSIFLLGGRAGVAVQAARLLAIRYPGLRIVGAAPGFEADQRIVEEINRASPDILLVGMGTPTQELWSARHRDALEVPVVWAVGALFDFVTGRIPRGPGWMTDHGLEWLCRLVVEPKKLWRRYLIGNPLFFWRIIRRYWL